MPELDLSTSPGGGIGPVPHPDLAGLRLKTASDPAIYLVDSEGLLRHIPSPATMQSLFLRSDGITIVSDLSSTQRGAPLSEGAFILMNEHQGFFLVSNGCKRHITAEAMVKYGFRFPFFSTMRGEIFVSMREGPDWDHPSSTEDSLQSNPAPTSEEATMLAQSIEGAAALHSPQSLSGEKEYPTHEDLPFPDAMPRPDLAGQRLKHPIHPWVYLVSDAGLLLFVFKHYYRLFDGNSGISLSTDLRHIQWKMDNPRFFDIACLVQGQQERKVYLLLNTYKHSILSPEIMNKYHFNWSAIDTVSDIILDCIEEGPNWT